MEQRDGEGLTPKRHTGRLSERITLCVEPELKDRYDLLMKEYEVAESIREYLRSICKSAKAG